MSWQKVNILGWGTVTWGVSFTKKTQRVLAGAVAQWQRARGVPREVVGSSPSSLNFLGKIQVPAMIDCVVGPQKQGSLKDTFCPFETWPFPPKYREINSIQNTLKGPELWAPWFARPFAQPLALLRDLPGLLGAELQQLLRTRLSGLGSAPDLNGPKRGSKRPKGSNFQGFRSKFSLPFRTKHPTKDGSEFCKT